MSRVHESDFFSIFLASIAALVLGSGSLACQDDGVLEQAGEKTDEAIDDITHPGEGPVEEAARKTGERAERLKEDIED